MPATAQPEDYLETALTALRSGNDWKMILNELPVPVYTTDHNGAVTYWNGACVDFAGREPQLGKDQWCVTWQLFTMSGEPIAHSECPMATAIQERRSVRGRVAIAKRPDGSRRAFTPYPTPLFDENGELEGAVNMLVDVSAEQSGALVEQASRCKRLAQSTSDPQTAEILSSMADGYADTAAALRES